ncbi:thioesterase superfamily protein [Desulfobulbus propionicus DSM 2032]|uniref:Thioesterase superfamily protein n=1 Tax=Desulfobulbus propionicus (strain ATCC 33891 / DSM 2032 / VKM B-1956 / 1pr3) TaxID=577650 RepID=A0A7U3YNM8_DESPD|nr:thioesterase family protein [Desulfobulbus propionicus]ADW18705.1 thioesterase superfamily protein [Desulfobulbus propionicus DSM 2032]
MSKLAINLMEPIFTTTYRVIYGDTDAAGVVYNANYLRYFEIGRTEMMRAWALPYSAIEQLGCILPVTESYLRFKAPAAYDDLITIAVSLVEVSKLTCRFHYAISREQADGKSTLLVKGFTVHACVNRQGKLTPFPQSVLDKIQAILEKSKSAA